MAVSANDSSRNRTIQRDELRAAIIRFLSGYSLEITPKSANQADKFPDMFPKGTEIYVTLIPGAEYNEVVDACIKVSKAGFKPVPHIPARSLVTHHDLDRYIGRAAEEAGTDHVLCIGGGVANPVGEFEETMQVLRSGVLERYNIQKIGVAGHPEGSPDIGEYGIRRALKEKNQFAEETDARMYICTQFTFDAEAVATWEKQLAKEGNKLNVHLGIPGPATIKTLLNYARMCGVGSSVKVLKKNSGNLLKVAGTSAPDELVTNIAKHTLQHPDTFLEAAHFYPFGGLTRTTSWVNQVVRGEFRMKNDLSGFEVSQPIG